MALARLRTIEEAYQEILKNDENTSITRCFIRKMCKESKIKSFKVGRKIFIDFDDLEEKINSLLINE